MTVVFGVIGRHGRQAGLPALEGISRSLEPFGSERLWSGDAGDLSVAIGERGGRQQEPSFEASARRGVLVVADTRLLQRPALCTTLGVPESTSDGQLIAAAYERWSTDLPERIRGDFAIAVVDLRRGGVFLVRDHAGSRPLALFDTPEIAAFASTALALTGCPGVGHELDEQRAVEVLLDVHTTNRTFVKGVETVPPGSAVWVDGSGSRRWRWWEGRFEVRDLGSVEAHASELRGALHQAVGHHLEGTVTPGVMLSGGLDSTSVAAVAAAIRDPEVVRSYTLVPPKDWEGPARLGWVVSEKPEVEALAARYPNLRPSYVLTSDKVLFKDELWWELGCPPWRNPMTSKRLFGCFRDAAADDVDVLMWAAAGNMAFSAGGDRWLAELARRGRLVSLVREIRSWSTTNEIPLVHVLRHHFLGRLFPRVTERHRRRRQARWVDDVLLASAVAPQQLDALDLDSFVDPVQRPHPESWTRDLGRIFHRQTTNAEMATAMRFLFRVELVDPTADRDLLEVAGTQPDWRRNHRGEWRAIARAAMRDALPPEIVERRELGEQLPEYLDLLTLRREELRQEIEEMRDHHASRETLDVGRLEALLADWPDPNDRNRRIPMLAYREALPKTIGVSRYMRWFEARARRVAAGGPAVVVHDPFVDFV